MNIELSRKSGKFNFEAVNSNGFSVELDANPVIGGEGKGFRPMELLLAGLGGCSGIDVVNILNKQNEPLNDIKIKILASRKENEIPPVFETIQIHFELYGVLNTRKIERALQLTFDKYCSVAMILSQTATINYTYTIINPEQ